MLSGVLRHLCLSPTRAPTRFCNMWGRFALRHKLLPEFVSHKSSRRRARTHLTLRFLHEHNVLLHSPLRAFNGQRGLRITPEFSRLALFGERLLRAEVNARLVKAMPRATASELASLLSAVVRRDTICAFYDKLELNGIISRAKDTSGRVKPTPVEKASMYFAIIAELHWMVVKTKATDRTHNNALFPPSDALVIHVLSAHCVESMMVELIHFAVYPAVRRVLPAWRNVTESLPAQVLHDQDQQSGAARKMLRLAPESAARPPTAPSISATVPYTPELLQLHPGPVNGSVLSDCAMRLNWKRFTPEKIGTLPQWSCLRAMSLANGAPPSEKRT